MELEIPKDGLISNKIVEVSKSPKILVYFDGSRYYAFSGICPHAKWPLELGKISDKTLTCGGHGWEFNITNGECITNPGRNLCTFNIIEEESRIIIFY